MQAMKQKLLHVFYNESRKKQTPDRMIRRSRLLQESNLHLNLRRVCSRCQFLLIRVIFLIVNLTSFILFEKHLVRICKPLSKPVKTCKLATFGQLPTLEFSLFVAMHTKELSSGQFCRTVTD